MADTAASTAYGPMFLSAAEQALPKTQRIVDDTLAYHMLPSYLQLAVKVFSLKPLRQAIINLLEKSSPGIQSVVLCRKRYIEDKLNETLKAEIGSVVILGAGLDTLAYRIPQLSTLRVYEVDLPKNIAFKKKRLETLYGSVPAHVRLVPLDFEDQTLENALKQQGYSFDQRSFFVWEGVTQYLTESAVRDTFRFLAKAKSGSRLVFTYVLKDFIDGQNLYGLHTLYRRYRAKSPIWLFGLRPHDVATFMGEYGWREVEQVGAEAFSERYLNPAGRDEAVAEIERAVYAEKM